VASPARLEDVNPADYDAVYVSGGHGLMEDLADNPVIGRIFAALYPDKSKAVAAVCHGRRSAAARPGSRIGQGNREPRWSV